MNDELVLIAFGMCFALILSLTELGITRLERRVLAQIGVLVFAGAILWALGLSVTHDAGDFLSADFGVVAMAGACGVGGFLPAQPM
jgi:hypothetical protein